MRGIRVLMAILFVFLFSGVAIANVNIEANATVYAVQSNGATDVADLQLASYDAENGELVNYRRGRGADDVTPKVPVVCGPGSVEHQGGCVPEDPNDPGHRLK